MGMTPTSMRLFALAHKEHDFVGPVLTFGNQDIWGTYSDVRKIVADAGLRMDESVIERTNTSSLFRALARKDKRYASYIHARTFFEMMGLVDYVDLDKYQQDSPQIVHDLNTQLPSDHCGKYGLVLDCGTTEHVFNVPNVLKTVVDALKPGGWVIHSLPLSSHYWSQHGYYCFSPDLLLDYYASNGFRNMTCRIAYYRMPYRSGNWHRTIRGKARYFVYTPSLDLRTELPLRSMPFIWFMAQKGEEPKMVALPNQGETSSVSPSRYEWIKKRQWLKKMLTNAYFATEPVSSFILRNLKIMITPKI